MTFAGAVLINLAGRLSISLRSGRARSGPTTAHHQRYVVDRAGSDHMKRQTALTSLFGCALSIDQVFSSDRKNL